MYYGLKLLMTRDSKTISSRNNTFISYKQCKCCDALMPTYKLDVKGCCDDPLDDSIKRKCQIVAVERLLNFPNT